MSQQPRMDHGGEIALLDRLAKAESEVSALRTSLEQCMGDLATAAETLRCETEERRWVETVLRRGEERYGFVVLHSLGIAITGIHDGDESQMAITVFSPGDFGDPFVDPVLF